VVETIWNIVPLDEIALAMKNESNTNVPVSTAVDIKGMIAPNEGHCQDWGENPTNTNEKYVENKKEYDKNEAREEPEYEESTEDSSLDDMKKIKEMNVKMMKNDIESNHNNGKYLKMYQETVEPLKPYQKIMSKYMRDISNKSWEVYQNILEKTVPTMNNFQGIRGVRYKPPTKEEPLLCKDT
jgi:hypothetical protein